MLADRPSRLPLGAALDGMTGALVAQAVVAAVLFSPVKGALQDGFDVVVLLYPLADVLLMGLVAAAVAHGGWRLDFWAVSLAGLVAITSATRARSPRRSSATTSRAAPPTSAGWRAPGCSRSPPGARRPVARPSAGSAAPCPSSSGRSRSGSSSSSPSSPHPLVPALACASGALAVVVGRLAITLHDNDRMLSVAAPTRDRRAHRPRQPAQLMTDLEGEVGAPPRRRRGARALRPQRLQGLQRHLRPSRRRRAAGGARHEARASRSTGAAAPTAWAATSSASWSTPAPRSPRDRRTRRESLLGRRTRVHGDRRPRRRRCSRRGRDGERRAAPRRRAHVRGQGRKPRGSRRQATRRAGRPRGARPRAARATARASRSSPPRRPAPRAAATEPTRCASARCSTTSARSRSPTRS